MKRPVAESDVLSFTEHLEELRYRLVVCVMALVVGALLGYVLAQPALRLLILPLERAGIGQPADPTTLEIRVDAQGRLRVAGGLDDPLAASPSSAPPRPGAPPPATSLPSRVPDSPSRVVFRLEGAPDTAPPLAVIGDAPPRPLIYLRPADPFFLVIKIAFLLGIAFSLPVILHQAWLFIAPGLTSRERRWATPVVLTGSVLFPLGVLFAYFLLTYALRFFAGYAVAGLHQQLDVRAYLSFALTTMLSFGLAFELPIAVFLAAQAGLVSPAFLRKRRREVFVLLLIVSAIVTPTTDPFTLMAMALPIYGLFEVSIWACLLLKRPVPEAARHPDENDTAVRPPSDTE